MSMHGTQAPKAVFNHGTEGEVTINFDHVLNFSDEPFTKFIEHESEIDLERNAVKLGTHRKVSFEMHLFKYGNAAQVLEKYNEIITYLGLRLSLWKHRDGTQYKTVDDEDALFVLKEVKSYYFDTAQYRDAIYVEFESINAVGNPTSEVYQYDTPNKPIYPEKYGITQTSNDVVALASAMSNGGEIHLTKANYNLTGKMVVDLAGKNLKLISTCGTVLNSTATQTTGNFFIPEGAFEFKNAGELVIEGVTFQAANAGASDLNGSGVLTNFLCGLLVEGCDTVKLQNITAKGAGYAGIRVYNVNQANILNCNASLNLYAGLMITGSKKTTIVGGSYSNNGIHAPVYGYGITTMERWGNTQDNEDVSITGATCNYNLRKGIDAHGAERICIDGCFVKGFVNAGIYAVNEGGNLQNYEKMVRDVKITNCIVENDSTWFDTLTFYGVSGYAANPISHPIQAGSYGDVENYDGSAPEYYGAGPGGSLLIQGCTIKNCSVADGSTQWLRHLISVFGGALSHVQIKNNTFEAATCENAIYITPNNYNQIRILDISGNGFIDITANIKPVPTTTNHIILTTSGRIININNNTIDNCTAESAVRCFEVGSDGGAGTDIQKVNINNNTITGTYQKGFHVTSGIELVNVNGNVFAGTYTDGLLIYVSSDLPQSVKNNIYNALGIEPAAGASISLPDFDSKSQGIARYCLETNNNGVTLNTLTVNAGNTGAGGYTSGSIMFDIQINSCSANEGAFGKWNFQATAGNSTGEPTFKANQLDPQTHEPAISWNVTGTTGTLQISLPDAYTSYQVIINFTSWRLLPYQKV